MSSRTPSYIHNLPTTVRPLMANVPQKATQTNRNSIKVKVCCDRAIEIDRQILRYPFWNQKLPCSSRSEIKIRAHELIGVGYVQGSSAWLFVSMLSTDRTDRNKQLQLQPMAKIRLDYYYKQTKRVLTMLATNPIWT